VNADKPYRPSNGTEGMVFVRRFCARCVKESEDYPCDIRRRALVFQIGEPQYPTEWIAEDGDFSARRPRSQRAALPSRNNNDDAS
jgi:hypothetical protein